MCQLMFQPLKSKVICHPVITQIRFQELDEFSDFANPNYTGPTNF